MQIVRIWGMKKQTLEVTGRRLALKKKGMIWWSRWNWSSKLFGYRPICRGCQLCCQTKKRALALCTTIMWRCIHHTAAQHSASIIQYHTNDTRIWPHRSIKKLLHGNYDLSAKLRYDVIMIWPHWLIKTQPRCKNKIWPYCIIY